MLTKSVAAYPPKTTEKLKFHQHPSSLLLPIFLAIFSDFTNLKIQISTTTLFTIISA